MTKSTERTIGELLRYYRLKASLKQDELASMLGYNNSHISRVERNERTPTSEYLQKFIQVLHLSDMEGDEIMHQGAAEIEPTTILARPESKQRQDWGEAPDVSVFFGRQEELAELKQWIVDDHCRVVALLGMGGLGKTTLATKLAQQTQGEFDYVIWRSLRNAPLVAEILNEYIQFLSDKQQNKLPEEVDKRISLFLSYLRDSRCLLILDNAESILQEGHRAGHYREGYEEFGDLIRRVGEAQHQSCLVLTAREKPKELAALEGETSPVRSFQLSGLDQEAGRGVLRDKGLSGSNEIWTDFIRRYSGNPLALKLVSETIREIFGGKIADFLNEETVIFGGVRDILTQQFERLSELEQDIMYWLAIEREPITLEDLSENIVRSVSRWELLEALNSLGRRFMTEKSATGFTMQSMVMEYVTNRLIERVYKEVTIDAISLFQSHALIKAQAKDYVRESQIRLILRPVVDKLLTTIGKKGIEDRLSKILSSLHETTDPQKPGYAGGNVLNILVQLKSDIKYYDFSNLTIWQAYLRDVELIDVNFAYANLAKSIFMEAFGGILTVAFSPNREIFAAGTTDSEIRLWQAVNLKQLLVYDGHTSWVRSVAFRPKSEMFASGSSDHSICLWDIYTGQCLNTLRGHTNRVRSVVFSPNGEVLASGSDDYTIRLWDVDSGQCLKILKGHSSSVRSVAFNPQGDLVVSGSEDHTIRFWNIHTGKCLNTIREHTRSVESVAFHPDGSVVASGSGDHMIRLWNVNTNQCLNSLQGHTNRVRSVVFSPNGEMLASGSYDLTVKLWDVRTGQCLKTLFGHTNWVRSVAFAPDNRRLVSGSDDQTVRLWDTYSGQCLSILQGYSNQVWSIAFSPDGRTLASSNEDQVLRLWDVSTGQYVKSLKGHTNRVNSIKFSPDGRICASGSDDKTIRLWNVQTGQLLKTLQGHVDRVTSVAFKPDGSIIASGSADQTIRLWHINRGQCVNTLQGHTNRIWSVVFSSDGSLLASCGDDQTVRLWDVSIGECINILKGHAGRVLSVAFNLNGQILASSSDDQTVRLWDTKSGQCLKILQGHIERVWSVVFSPDGSTLASSSEDQTVKLWDINSGVNIKTLRGHVSRVRSVAYAPEDDLLASCSDDGTIKVWAVKSGECLQALRSDRPNERMNIMGVTGLTDAQKITLKALGAIEMEVER